MAEYRYQEILPTEHLDIEYRTLSTEHVAALESAGRHFLEVSDAGLTLLAREAMRDIAFFLRPGHLAQLRSILDDSDASIF
jgi:fumarate hydratase class I